MKFFEAKTLNDFQKVGLWIEAQKSTNFSVLCWAVWHKTDVSHLVSLLNRPKAHVVWVEDDTGKIRAVLYFEFRTVEEEKISEPIATFASSVEDENDWNNNDGTYYKALLDWAFRNYGYPRGVYRGDFFAVEQITKWLQELCGTFLTVTNVGSNPYRPDLGQIYRFTIDIKGYVESKP